MSQKGCSANVEREEKGIQSEESMNVDVDREKQGKEKLWTKREGTKLTKKEGRDGSTRVGIDRGSRN